MIAAIGTSLLSGVAGAQVTPVGSFEQIPGGVFFNITNGSPCGIHFRDNVPITVGDRTITWSCYSTVTLDHRYPMGCINYSSTTWNTWRITPNQSIDPGDFTGDYMVPEDGNGDVIINFSEPLTAFGSTSLLGPFANSSRPQNMDTFTVYDGPNATGNALATVSTADIIHLQLRLDFVGVVSPTPIIRSVRYDTVFRSISIDGFAVAVAGLCCSCDPDFDGDGDAGTDLDIEAFFLCLGGECCAACGSPDFDGDGDSGTDLDIETFFRVLGGGSC